ncbi:MAG TPA: 50S ribosomal protein L29 [Bacteroidetes bacterium]|nr:50S ribosomal protein L29 [Bacteroidota bacterium]HCN36118.1 50S ribosomal protein L29 [Bacteroidota bacterium]
MKIYQIRELSTEDLKNAINDNYDALENYRFQKATSQLENYKAVKNTKRDIAQMLTVLKERELGLNLELKDKSVKSKSDVTDSVQSEEKPKKKRTVKKKTESEE